jgi:hypothetical protein
VKLRKQTRLKALVTALTTGLFLLFLGLVRAQPQIEAEANVTPPSTPDYERIFAPSVNGSAAETPAPQPSERPHTRTRAS